LFTFTISKAPHVVVLSITLNQILFTWQRYHNIEGSMGNQMTKGLMKGGSKKLGSHKKIIWVMWFGVLDPSNFGVVKDLLLWLMGSKVEGCWNLGFFGASFFIFFKDWVSHGMVRVCNISQLVFEQT
jgi:hypothetical protein